MEERVHNFFIKRAFVLVILALLALVGWLVYGFYKTSQIDSFDKCKAAGNPIMESYPEQCRANGKTFINK